MKQNEDFREESGKIDDSVRQEETAEELVGYTGVVDAYIHLYLRHLCHLYPFVDDIASAVGHASRPLMSEAQHHLLVHGACQYGRFEHHYILLGVDLTASK